MEQSLRKLQIFRNGELLTGSVAYVKGLINTAFTEGKIVLNDGEPISIRYREDDKSSEIKSLFGVAYINGDNKSILWNDSGITIDTNPKNGDFVTLNYVVDDSGKYTLTVAATTISVKDATAADEEGNPVVNGLATALDVKNYVDEQINGIPEYTIQSVEIDGYLKSYQLFKGETGVGEVINIPKDYLVKSATLNIVTEENKPQNGFKVGDKYIDFVINTKDSESSDGEHLYINVTDLVDVYTEGNGISIDGNQISVKIKSGEQYIAVDENGIHTNVQTIADASKDSNGLATALDVKEYVDNYDCGTFTLTDNDSGSTEQQ